MSHTNTDRVEHTPGPWAQSHRESYSARYKCDMYNTEVYDAKGVTIATVAWYPDHRVDGSIGTLREPNAHLISAAPDMLEALEGLQSILDRAESNASGNPGYEAVELRIKDARAAISKARGQS